MTNALVVRLVAVETPLGIAAPVPQITPAERPGVMRRMVMSSIPFVGSPDSGSFDHAAPPSIACRWHVDHAGVLRLFWPIAGNEASCTALGWVAADEATGFIEACASGVSAKLLDLLEQRFPGRRWYEGAWDDGLAVDTDAAGDQRAAA
ncbi:MAG: hypothetical protein AAF235_09695 [Planctomycetota bacterium]